jgi:hypothetical protein
MPSNTLAIWSAPTRTGEACGAGAVLTDPPADEMDSGKGR